MGEGVKLVSIDRLVRLMLRHSVTPSCTFTRLGCTSLYKRCLRVQVGSCSSKWPTLRIEPVYPSNASISKPSTTTDDTVNPHPSKWCSVHTMHLQTIYGLPFALCCYAIIRTPLHAQAFQRPQTLSVIHPTVVRDKTSATFPVQPILLHMRKSSGLLKEKGAL